GSGISLIPPLLTPAVSVAALIPVADAVWRPEFWLAYVVLPWMRCWLVFSEWPWRARRHLFAFVWCWHLGWRPRASGFDIPLDMLRRGFSDGTGKAGFLHLCGNV